MDTAFDLEVEQAVLGAFLIDDSAAWSRIGDVFCPEPFYLSAHQAIAAAIIAHRANAAPTDPILLHGDLADAGNSDAADLVFPLASGVGTSADISCYWERLDGLSPLNVLRWNPKQGRYSPLWDVHLATWTPAAIAAGQNLRQRDYGDVTGLADHGLVTAPDGSPFAASGFIVNCPIISSD